MTIAAQDWQKEIKNDSNFFEIQKAYYNDPDHVTVKKTEPEDGPDELYKRWEQFVAPRVNAKGNPIAPDILYKEWAAYQKSQLKYKTATKNGDWTFLGPKAAPNNSGGTGRINCIRFQPGNPKIMWAGTPSGGLWKSTDMGKTWSSNTDKIPSLGVTDVAINPRNTDTMFLATGDGYGYSINNGTFFGGGYSNGIMRSVNGGQTWDTTSLNWTNTKSRQLFRVIVYPENPNVVITISNSGIWRSTDAGKTWKNVLTDKCTDIKMNTGTHSTMYAGGSSFFISTDTGATWSKVSIKYPINVGAMTLATTAANQSIIYMLALNGFASSAQTILMCSKDGGMNWNTMSTISATSFYGYYTPLLAADPNNSAKVFVGGLNILQTTDSGKSWSQVSYDNNYPSPQYVHPDHRVFEFFPGSSDTVFNGNDGGMFMSIDGGNNWSLTSDDINALELYRIGSSSSDPSELYTGAQDNGVNQMYQGTWARVIGGDGMTCQVAWDDPAVGYGSWQNGNVERTLDYGASWTYLYTPSAGTANWTAPFVIDPLNSYNLLYGGDQLYMSQDQGSSWNSISGTLKSPVNVSNIAYAPSDDNTIYFTMGSYQSSASSPRIYVTKDAGTTWTNISKGLASISVFLTGLAVDRRDPKHFAICFSGYSSNQKIYISKDGGTTYTNISAGLPNLPVNCVTFEYSVENGIFIGTDVGVFYRNDKTGGWIAYNNGLPNVIVNQLEVFPAAYKIRAATYGRGVWDGTLTGTISGIEKISDINSELKIFPNPSVNGIFSVKMPYYSNKNPDYTIVNTLGEKIASGKLMDYSTGNTSTIDMSNYVNGIYFININLKEGIITKKVQLIR